MNLFSVFLTAIGLSMDAFAVSLCIGMSCKAREKTSNAFKAGAYFGGFQGLMPLIGYFLSVKFTRLTGSFDGIIAFVILAFLGAKMIYESVSQDDIGRIKNYSFGEFLALAVATSIDALAVGVSFALIKVDIVSAACVIALTTFVLSFCAVLIGKKTAKFLGNKAEILGGIILIIIGIKILLF